MPQGCKVEWDNKGDPEVTPRVTWGRGPKVPQGCKVARGDTKVAQGQHGGHRGGIGGVPRVPQG